MHQRRVLPGGSVFKRWIRCEPAVRGDVGEDLLDEGEHVGVFDGVDVVAAFLAGAGQALSALFYVIFAAGLIPILT
jgi:hypothetical protein